MRVCLCYVLVIGIDSKNVDNVYRDWDLLLVPVDPVCSLTKSQLSMRQRIVFTQPDGFVGSPEAELRSNAHLAGAPVKTPLSPTRLQRRPAVAQQI